jgi:ABC-2 type transport system permease protein
MSLWRPALLLTVRALRQFPRLPAVLVFSMVPPLVQFLLFGAIFGNLPDLPSWKEPTDNYYEFLAPAVVFFTTILGIANAGVALVNDFENGYFNKILLAPVNMWAILLGRLLSDGLRVYIQAAVILVLALFFDGSVATGLPGALLMLLLSTLFSIVTVGVLVTNVAIKTKSAQAVQAIFPVFFILIFLTSAFMPKANVDSDVVRSIMSGNPAEYVVLPMRSLMLEATYDAPAIGLAFAIIAAFAIVGVLLTRFNYRSVYK